MIFKLAGALLAILPPVPTKLPPSPLRCAMCGPQCDWHLYPCQQPVTEKRHCGCPGALTMLGD